MEDYNDIGQKIQKAREYRGMTRTELADAIGKKARGILQWESGARNPKIDTIIKIANALHFDLEYFVEDLRSQKPKAESTEYYIAQNNINFTTKDLDYVVDNYGKGHSKFHDAVIDDGLNQVKKKMQKTKEARDIDDNRGLRSSVYKQETVISPKEYIEQGGKTTSNKEDLAKEDKEKD